MTRGAMLAIAVAAVAGCETAPVSTSTSRDSLGVTIVESAAPLWTAGAGWWIDEEPVIDLAETGSGDMHLFYRVGDVLRTPAGDLAVADRGSQQIRIYDAGGRYLRAFGGPGDGPGEFRSLWSVVLTHDGTLLGLDYRAGGPGAEFDIESGLVGTFSFPGEANPVRHPVPSDIVWGLDHGYAVETDGLEQGLRRHAFTIVRTSEDRTLAQPVTRVPGYELVFFPEVEVNPLMGRMTHVVPTGQGEVVVGLADGLEYSVLDGQTGEVRSIARILGISLAVTREEVDRERQVRLGPNPRPFIRDLLDRLPIPAEKPAYQGMLVDVEGNVWAGEYLGLARRDEPQDWYVWDAAGIWLGVVETPARFELMRAGSDEVFGVRRDDNDVEHPQVLRLVKPRNSHSGRDFPLRTARAVPVAVLRGGRWRLSCPGDSSLRDRVKHHSLRLLTRKCGRGWDHEVDFAIDGGSAGLEHDCHGNHPACGSSMHECGGVMTLNERNELVRMNRRSTAPVLTAVDAEQPNLSINYKRGTTQILGCDRAVIASIAWTPEQAEAFGEWGPSRSSH